MGVASTLFIILLASFAVPGEAARTGNPCDMILPNLPKIINCGFKYLNKMRFVLLMKRTCVLFYLLYSPM